MEELILLIALIACVTLFFNMRPRSAEPQIVILRSELAPQPQGGGCLIGLFLIGVVMLTVLALLQG